MSNKIKCIWIGKLKKTYWQVAVDEYLKKISGFFAIGTMTLKDGPSGLPPLKKREAEQKAILKSLQPRDYVIALDSRGTQYTSPQFAQCLQSWLQDPGRDPCFVLGGPYGLSEAVKKQSRLLLSFGLPTLPHELARVLLLEQIYRAGAILWKHPYHH
jgi:23S rRNA (pseudouridine1915-N3)-methyltransferase